eukprot:403366261
MPLQIPKLVRCSKSLDEEFKKSKDQAPLLSNLQTQRLSKFQETTGLTPEQMIEKIFEQAYKHFVQLEQADDYFQPQNNDAQVNLLQTGSYFIRKFNLNFTITQQYLHIIDRCLKYEEDIMTRPIIKRIFSILNIVIKNCLMLKDNQNILMFDFESARQIEDSKRINQQYIQKIISIPNFEGSIIDRQNNEQSEQYQRSHQVSSKDENLQKLVKIFSQITNQTLNTKIQYINLISQQQSSSKIKESIRLKNDNLTLVFEILNSLQKYRADLFIENFIEKYLKSSFQYTADQFKRERDFKNHKNQMEQLIEESFRYQQNKFKQLCDDRVSNNSSFSLKGVQNSVLFGNFQENNSKFQINLLKIFIEPEETNVYLYQNIMLSLGTHELLLSMVKEYQGYLREILSSSQKNELKQVITHEKSIKKYELMMSSIYELMSYLIRNNEKLKKEFISQIPNLYPVSMKKDFGEVRLVCKIVKFKDYRLNKFQLETLESYVKNIMRDNNFSLIYQTYSKEMTEKFFQLCKLVLFIVETLYKADRFIEETLIKYIKNIHVDEIVDPRQIQIIGKLFSIINLMVKKHMMDPNNFQVIKDIFSQSEEQTIMLITNLNKRIDIIKAQPSDQSPQVIDSLQIHINTQLQQLMTSLLIKRIEKHRKRPKILRVIEDFCKEKVQNEKNKEFMEQNFDLKQISQREQNMSNPQVFDYYIQKSIDSINHYKVSEMLSDVEEEDLNEGESLIVRQKKQKKQKPRKVGKRRSAYLEVRSPTHSLDHQTKVVIADKVKQLMHIYHAKIGNLVLERLETSKERKKIEEEFRMMTMYRRMIQVLQLCEHSEVNTSLLQSILHNFNEHFNFVVSQATIESVRSFHIQQLQKNLDGINFTDTLLRLMSKLNIKTLNIYPDLLSSMNVMLMGGQVSIQNKVYEFFTTDTQSEMIFTILGTVFEDVIRQLDERLMNYTERQNSFLHLPKIMQQTSSYDFKQITLLDNAILFMKQLCEGHHKNHQRYLSQQTNSNHSVNLIQLLLRLLEKIMTSFITLKYMINEIGIELTVEQIERIQNDPKLLDKIRKTFNCLFEGLNYCLATILEMIQGPCEENQRQLLDSQFLEIGKMILNLHFICIKPSSNLHYQFWNKIYAANLFDFRLQKVKANLLFIIIELLDGKSKEENIFRIQQFITLEDLEKTIKNHYKLMIINKSPESIFNTEVVDNRKIKSVKPLGDYWIIIEVAISAQIIREIIYQSYNMTVNYIRSAYKFLKDLSMSFKFCRSRKILRHKQQLKQKALDFFSGIIMSIEVQKDDQLQTLFFPKLPVCQYKSNYLTDKLKYDADRTSQKSKVESLMNLQEDFILEMQSESVYMENQLYKKVRFLGVIAKHNDFFKDSAFYYLIGLHLFILSTYDTKGYLAEFQEVKYMADLQKITITLVWIMVGFASFIFVFVIMKRVIMVTFKQDYQDQLRLHKKIQNYSKSNGKKKSGLVLRLGDTTQEKFAKGMKIIGSLFQDFNFLYYMLYIVFALLAITIHPFFIAFHLSDIIIRSPLLKDLLMAIWEPKEQIILTILLFFVIEYVFSLVAFGFFYEYFPDYNCTGSLVQCFVVVLDQTFKAGAGIGGYMTSPYNKEEPKGELQVASDVTLPKQKSEYNYINYGRVLFDQIFNFIILILIIQIISGIIIDTFSNLREKQKYIADDLANKCFICGMSREDIEKKEKSKNSFRYHVEMKHNEWHYIYYLTYLKQKPQLDYTGTESYIMEMINSQDNSWFPDQSEQTDEK